ncbi:DegV family protein [Brevibacillus laterosporus]|uniref:DegV family protein n=1 Tax=Brevibacillus laterosporus TaxID=1465 RepID=UPI0002404DB2|nr:DegV family protein [Brevibacillus laterosporus]AUM66685.1 DegV family protein [Brevibacillus laterosporus]ERM17582.1 fatty acid-binding protein DegV [Brevibacillus laterosporus PE36]MDF9413261.1 DegV family protein [Brevibacillus laterosporus]PCN42735.1 fatty acid-binding protein DegV [Brevibacillus laterosporus]CCF13551.1 EDD, DegV family domain protein [Brevibacillus laterosporus GI-9]
MKKQIAWVTDSTAYIPADLREKHDIYVVPLEIIFSDGTYRDGLDMTPEQLYEKIEKTQEVPKTSQPSLGNFVELYETLKQKYDCAIAVHVSSKLSGTLNASQSAAKLAEFPVEVVDSKTMSYPITHMILQGMKMAKTGASPEKIASSLRLIAEKTESYILLGSLDQFYRGGRMNGVQFFMGNLLQIKPILRIRDGIFEVYEKIRTENKAIVRMLAQLDQAMQKQQIKNVQILHGNVMEKAQALKKRIKEKYQDVEVMIGPISSTIGVHAGQGTIALSWINE